MSEDSEYGVLSDEDKSFLKDKGFEVLANIGSAFDHLVFKAKTVEGQLVAVKYLEITCKRKHKYLDREIAITDFLRANPHKNLIKVLENIRNELKNKVFVVMEFGEAGDLVSFFRNRKWTPIEESQAKNWFSQLISGVKWLHDNGIAHRDIKADNIVLFREGDSFQLKITDLEMAIQGIRKVGRFCQTIKCETVCGSLEYCCPEMFVSSYNPFLADIYSLGVILYIFIAGISPFSIYGSELLQLKDRIAKTLQMKTNPNFRFQPNTDPSVQALVTRMCEPNPQNRVTLTQILTSEWMTTGSESQEVGNN